MHEAETGSDIVRVDIEGQFPTLRHKAGPVVQLVWKVE